MIQGSDSRSRGHPTPSSPFPRVVFSLEITRQEFRAEEANPKDLVTTHSHGSTREKGRGGGEGKKHREKHSRCQESFPKFYTCIPGISNPIGNPLEFQGILTTGPSQPAAAPLPRENKSMGMSEPRRILEQQFQAGNIPCLPLPWHSRSFPSFQRNPRKNRGGGRGGGGKAPETFRGEKTLEFSGWQGSPSRCLEFQQNSQPSPTAAPALSRKIPRLPLQLRERSLEKLECSA